MQASLGPSGGGTGAFPLQQHRHRDWFPRQSEWTRGSSQSSLLRTSRFWHLWARPLPTSAAAVIHCLGGFSDFNLRDVTQCGSHHNFDRYVVPYLWYSFRNRQGFSDHEEVTKPRALGFGVPHLSACSSPLEGLNNNSTPPRLGEVVAQKHCAC